MIEFIFTVIAAALFYVIFMTTTSIINDVKTKKYRIEDNRDTDEKRIAGEDTSEIALNYLKKL